MLRSFGWVFTNAWVPREAIQLSSLKCWFAFVTGWPVGSWPRGAEQGVAGDWRHWLQVIVVLKFSDSFQIIQSTGQAFWPRGSVVIEVMCTLLFVIFQCSTIYSRLHVQYYYTPDFSHSRLFVSDLLLLWKNESTNLHMQFIACLANSSGRCQRLNSTSHSTIYQGFSIKTSLGWNTESKFMKPNCSWI